MELLIDNRQNKYEIGRQLVQLLRRAASACLAYEGWDLDYEISLSLVDNEEIRELNRIYRKKNCPTDVLSFPMISEDQIISAANEGEKLLGDIVISVEKAVLQASKYSHSFEREMVFLFVHSMFHLMGHNHNTEKSEKDMEAGEEAVLSYLNLVRK